MSLARSCCLGAVTLAMTLAPVHAQDSAPEWRGEVLTQTLPNGLTIFVLENHAAPLAVVNTWFRVGGRNEADPEEGISHFLEHMLFNGFEGYTNRSGEARLPGGLTLDEYNRIILTRAAYDNASTDQDNTNYYQYAPVRYFPELVRINRAMVSGPRLLDEHFSREREVVKEELRRGLDNPIGYLWDEVIPKALAHTGYDHSVIGTIAGLDAQSNDLMREYYHRYYGPNNAFVVAIGDFNAEEALAVIREEFASWEPVTIAPAPEIAESAQSAPALTIYPRDFATTYLLGIWPTVPANDPAVPALEVLATILGSGDSSRLVSTVQNELGLVSSISAWTSVMIDQSVLGIDVEYVDPAQTAEATNTILAVLGEAVRNGVTEDEVARAKRKLLLRHQFLGEDIQDQAYSMGYMINATGGPEFELEYAERISGVTKADVDWAAQRFLARAPATFGVATTTDGLAELPLDWNLIHLEGTLPDPPADLGRLGVNPFATESAAPERHGQPVFGSGTTIDAPPHLPALARFTLANGLEVLISPAPSNGTVGISLAAKGGLGLESWDNAGIANLMTTAMTRGTTTHDTDALGALIDSLGGRFEAAAERDVFTLQGLFASADMGSALALIHELAGSATFPDEEVATSKEIQLSKITARADDSYATTRDQLDYALYGPDSAYGRPPLGRPSVIAELTPAQVRAFYAQAFVPSNLVLAIAGDLTVEDARAQVEASLGTLPGGTAAPALPAASTIHPPEGFQRILNNADKAQTVSYIGRPGLTITDPDLPAVQAVNQVLGGNWLGRLFDRLRGKEGLAYGTYSYIAAYLGGGIILADIGTRPETWEQAITGLRREFGLIATEGVTQQELSDAVNYLVGQADRNHASVQAQAAFIAMNVARGLAPDFEWQLLDRMQAVTLDEANAAAVKYFTVDNAYLAVTGPITKPPAALE